MCKQNLSRRKEAKIICSVTSRHKEKMNPVSHKHTSILQQCAAGGDQLEARLGVYLCRELEHVTFLHALPAKKPWVVKWVWGGEGRAILCVSLVPYDQNTLGECYVQSV